MTAAPLVERPEAAPDDTAAALTWARALAAAADRYDRAGTVGDQRAATAAIADLLLDDARAVQAARALLAVRR